MPEVFGLIGKKLSHSFSKSYFTEKFERERLKDHRYELFELEHIGAISDLVNSNPDLKGLNVTIPYKEEVLPFLDQINKTAQQIGAVNVIKVKNGTLHGYNSDYYGFKKSLLDWADVNSLRALILGTGGASKAVMAALNDLSIPFKLVSRSTGKAHLTYDQLEENSDIIREHQLIINTTPLGMHPQIDTKPAIDYKQISASHYLYDLVYNPEKTAFLKAGESKGAKIKNGLEMLHLQAERSWELWNTL